MVGGNLGGLLNDVWSSPDDPPMWLNDVWTSADGSDWHQLWRLSRLHGTSK